MATEYIQKSYYEDDKNKFIDIHTSTKIAIEGFLADLLFKSDLNKIIYATQDICFRRRIELVDGEHKDLENIQPINLNLPFANFYQTSEWEDDDRPASIQAAQSVSGEYLREWNRNLRSTAVKSTYKATAFFSRRDDVRLATQLLYWEKIHKYPVQIYNKVTWKEKDLLIPVFITLENINSNIDYQESEWLEKSRIFPIEIEMTVRSYEILIPNIKNIIDLPIRFGNLNAWPDYDSDDEMYITQEALLMWANQKWGFENNHNKLNADIVTENAKLFFNPVDNYEQKDLEEMCGKLPNYQGVNIISGYWSETYEVALNRYEISQKTDHSLTLTIIVKPSDYQFFEKIEIYVPGHPDIISTDPRQKTYQIDNLYARSTYDIKIVTFGKNGLKTLFNLQGTTEDSETNLAPSPDNVYRNSDSNLVAPSNIKTTIKRKGNSLLGMEF